MATLYRVCDWDQIFENAASRKIASLRWVAMPNKHDSDGYLYLVDHPNGAAHYGAWAALVQVASKCQPRGSLLGGNSQPYGIAQIARKTSLPVEIFEEVIPRLIDPLGWLLVEEIDSPQDQGGQQDTITLPADSQPSGSQLPADSQPSGAEPNRTEPNRREGEGRELEGKELKSRPAGSGPASSEKNSGSGWGSDVTTEGLRDDAALTGYFLAAVRCGIVGRDSRAARLAFWTAAIHALRKGKKPAAMFVANARAGRWHGTDAEEDWARKRLKALEHGES